MKRPLITLIIHELLEEFGVGSHKPGSGSAAALQGMISAKLLVTVISITNHPDYRERYSETLPMLLEMQTKINDHIYPRLTRLFEADSIQFGRTIEAREARDKEDNLIEKNKLKRIALAELKVSVDIPLEIASLCVEVGYIGQFVFDHAFQSARGDSQVGISGAVAAIASCLSIVRLNILPFGSDEYFWISNIKRKCDVLGEDHGKLNKAANDSMDSLAKKVDAKTAFYKQVDTLINGAKSKEQITNAQLEDLATNLQNLLWSNQKSIWGKNSDITYMDVLDPSIIFDKVLGYTFINDSDLDIDYIDGHLVDVAGIIDQNNKSVQISNHTSPQIQNFTAAHELGHALLHSQSTLHRDIPMDGNEQASRSVVEQQADRFAAFFLMPKRLVRDQFQLQFQTNLFQINSDTAFGLTANSNTVPLRSKCKNLRGLCLKLASANTYDGKYFRSLASQFNVTVIAMAIRLEQLGLVQY